MSVKANVSHNPKLNLVIQHNQTNIW